MKYTPSTTLAATVAELRQWIINELQRLSIILRNEDTAFDTKIEAVAENASASLTAESTVRANADNALASSLVTVNAQVDDNTAEIQNEITARANADSALSSQISTVSAQVGSKNRTFAQGTAPTNPTGSYSLTVNDEWINTSDSNKINRWTGSAWSLVADTRIASVVTQSQANADSITGINAQYSVTVSAGKVTGFKLISSGTTSDFIVQADRFQIENSSGVPFKVVGGTVFINDNRVDTASMVANAVTAVVSSLSTSTVNVTSASTFLDLQSVSITSTGRPTLVNASSTVLVQVTSGSLPTAARIDFSIDWQDDLGSSGTLATNVFHTSVHTTNVQSYAVITIPAIHSAPTAGRTYTYKMRAVYNSASVVGLSGLNHRVMTAQEIKR